MTIFGVSYLTFQPVLISYVINRNLYFTVDNYKVTVYTGNKYLAGTDARVFVELFGQTRNSGEVELAGKKNAFEMDR